jgi:hypothetical protein
MVSEYLFLALFAFAGLFILWRLFGLPSWRVARERRWKAQWPKTDLERLLVEACDSQSTDDRFLSQFVQSVLYAPYDSDDSQTPLTVSARFHRSIATEADADAVIDGDYLVLGPWTWCFTSERRVAEIQSHPLYSVLLQGGVTPFPAIRLLQHAEKESTTLVVNPMLAFGRTFGLVEIQSILRNHS